MKDLYFQGKKISIKTHAIKRARRRNISYPCQVRNVLETGKIKRFGKNMLKFTKKSKTGCISCVGEDLGKTIIIKTITRSK